MIPLKRQLEWFITEFERLINECEPQNREYMRRECSGSINMLKQIIDKL